MALRDLIPGQAGRETDLSLADPFRHFHDMERLLTAMRMGTAFGALPSATGPNGMGMPTLDIAEDEGAFEVTVDVPGVEKDKINVSLENGVLTVSGTRETENTEGGEGKSYHRVERHRGQFVRRIAIPADIDESAIEARYDQGVLSIRLPKTLSRSGEKRIEIKSAP